MTLHARLLAGTMLIAASAAQAQTYPDRTLQGDSTIMSGGVGIVRTPTVDTLTISTAQAVVNWNPETGPGGPLPAGTIDFLPNGRQVVFQGAALGQDFIVLNRVLPSVATRDIAINGTVTSQVVTGFNPIVSGPPVPIYGRGGSVWFYSPGGIIAGATSVFNVGNLVLTAADIDTTGGLLGATGIRFRGASGSTSAVTARAGAQFNITNPGSYLALVAPQVSMAGTATVSGSVAYVAAEAVDVRFTAGLVDVAFVTGTGVANALTHSGTTVGAANSGAIVMAALPKNTAITMLVGGSVGYTPAATATVQNGSVVLSAGFDVAASVSNGVPKSATSADITIGTANFTTSVDARASGRLLASPIGPGLLSFASNATLRGYNSATVDASGGESITVGGALSLLSNYADQPGQATLLTTPGAGVAPTINVAGATIVDASGRGVQIAGVGNPVTGGTAQILAQLGTITLTGGFAVSADATSSGGFPSGAATGGTARFTVSSGATLTDGVSGVIPSNVSARAIDGASGTNLGRPMQGGTASVAVAGSLRLAGLAIDAGARGDGANGGGTGGSATGGSALLTQTSGTITTGNLRIGATARAGGGSTTGTATGGSARFDQTGGTTTTGGTTIDASADIPTFGSPFPFPDTVLPARGGLVRFTASGSSFTGDLALIASATVAGDPNATTVSTATGGLVQLNAQNAATVTGASIALTALGAGGQARATGVAGSGAGGSASLSATTGATFTTTQGTTVNVNGYGSVGGTAGNGTGGTATLALDTATLRLGGGLDVQANGYGAGALANTVSGIGQGGRVTLTTAGPAAAGLFATPNLSATADGLTVDPLSRFFIATGTGNGGAGRGGSVDIMLNGATFTVPIVVARANGTGADANTVGASPASLAGVGSGGRSNFILAGGSATLTNLTLGAAGQGGTGVEGTLTARSAIGGTGNGGTAGFAGSSGTLTAAQITVDARGSGGAGFAGSGTDGGNGGAATGGNATFTTSATGDVRATGFVQALGSAIGGAGGAGSACCSAPLSFLGGGGGAATGGSARIVLDSDLGAIPTLLLSVSATGGVGGVASSLDATQPNKTGGAGGSATAGTGSVHIGTAQGNFTSVDLAAMGTGGGGGNGATGGAGGRASGGTLAFDLTERTAQFGALSLAAGALGGKSGVSARGAGGAGADATAGSATLGVNGTAVGGGYSANLSLTPGGPFNLDVGAAASNGGDGVAGFANGTGGTATGGAAAIVATTGTIDLTSLATLALGANATGGRAGSVASPGLAASDGRAAGGSVSLSAVGGEVRLPATNLSANGTAANALASGGNIVIEATRNAGLLPGRLSAGVIALAAQSVSMLASTANVDGTIVVRNAGSALTVASLAASAGVAGPRTTGRVRFEASDAAIFAGGAIGATSSGAVEVAAMGNGVLSGGGALDLRAGTDIVVTHVSPPGGDFATFNAASATLIAGGSIQASGSGLFAATTLDLSTLAGAIATGRLRAPDRVSVLSAQGVTVDGARATGAVAQGTGNGPVGGLIDLAAGVANLAGSGRYDAGSVTVAGVVQASGIVRLRAGSDAIVASGAQLLSNNRIELTAGDDVLVRGGALVRAGIAALPELPAGTADPFARNALILVQAGSLPIGYAPSTGDISVVVNDGSFRADGGTLYLSGAAVQSDAAPVLVRDAFLLTPGAPAPGAAASNDGGQLRSDCLGGGVCFGAANATGLVQVGPLAGITGLPNAIGLSGSLTASTVQIRARDLIALSGSASIAAAGVSLESVTGDIALAGASSISASATATYRSGRDLIGTGATVRSAGNAALGVGRDLRLGSLSAGGQLRGLAGPALAVPGAVVIGALTAGAGGIDLTGGTGIDLGSVAVSAAAPVQLVTTTGDVRVASLGAAGNGTPGLVTLRAPGGNVLTTALNASGVVQLIASGRVTGTTTASGDLVVQAGQAGIALGTASAAGDMTLTTPGGIGATSLTSTRLIATGTQGIAVPTIRAAGTVSLTASAGQIAVANDVSAGGLVDARGLGVLLNGASNIAASALVATSGDVVLTTAQLTATSVTASRDVRLNGTNGISVATLAAGGDTALTATQGSVRVDALAASGSVTASGRSVTLTAPAALAIASASATAGDLALNATTVIAPMLSASNDLSVTATAGPLALGNASAGRDLLLTSQGNTAFAALQAGRDIQIAASSGNVGGTSLRSTGGSATVSGRSGIAIASLSAPGTVSLSALNGQVAIASDLSAGGPVDASGLGVALVSTGALAATTLNATGGDIVVTAGSLAATTVAASRNVQLTGTGGLTVASLSSGGTTALAASAGAVRVDRLASPGPVTASGRSVALVAPGSLTLALATATAGDLVVTGASIAAPSIGATGDIVLSATSGDLTLASPSAGRDFRLTTPGTLSFTALNAGRTLTATGALLTGGGIRTTSGGVILSGTGGVALTSIVAGGSVALTGGVFGPVDVGRIDATGAPGANVTASSVANGTLGAPSARLQFGDIAASGDVSIGTSKSAVVVGNVTAGGTIELSGLGITTGRLNAGVDVLLAASTPFRGPAPGDIATGDIVAGDDIVITDASAFLAGPFGAVRTGTLTSTGLGLDTYASVGGQTGETGRLVLARALGPVTIGGATNSPDRAIVASDFGAVVTGALTAPTGIAILSGATTSLGTVMTAGQFVIRHGSQFGGLLPSYQPSALLTAVPPANTIVQAVGPVTLTDVRAGDVSILADGSIGYASIAATRRLDLQTAYNQGNSIVGGALSGGSSLSILGNGDVRFTTASGGSGTSVEALTVAIATSGSVVGGALTSSGYFNLSANAGPIDIGTIVGGGSAFASSLTSPGGAIRVAELRSTAPIIANGRSVFLRSSTSLVAQILGASAGGIDVASVGNLTVNDAQATASVALASSGGDSVVGNIGGAGRASAPTSASVSATGMLTIASAATGGLLALRSGGLTTLQGNVLGASIDIRSGDIAINPTAQVGQLAATGSVTFTNTSGLQTLVGGSTSGAGYRLSEAELQRVFAQNIGIGVVPAPLGGVQTGQSLTPGRAPDLVLDTLTLAVGTNLGAAGTLRITTPGKVRVVGAVTLNGATAATRLELAAPESIEALPTSSIVLNGGTGLSGTLAMTSADIVASSAAALTDVAAAATVGAASDRLARNDGAASDGGYFQAGTIVTTVSGGIYVQNSGRSQLVANRDFGGRRGFTVGSGGFTVVQASAAPIRVAINGRQVGTVSASGRPTFGGFVTGTDLAPGIAFVPFNSATPINFQGTNSVAERTRGAAIFDLGSTVDGCAITASLACQIQPGDPTRDFLGSPASNATGGKLLPFVLVQLRDLIADPDQPLIDEPVTGAGNDDLWSIDDGVRRCDPATASCPPAD